VRLRLLEAFWAGSGLGARERRARLDAVLQESLSHLEPAVRNRVAEQVLEELARWAPSAGPAGTASGGEGLHEAMVAGLLREPAPKAPLSPEEQRLVDCVRAMVEHLSLESQNHVLLLKDVVRGETVSLPIEFLQVLRGLVKTDAGRDGSQGVERLKGVLRDLQIGRNVLFSGARAAAGQALARLVADLDPAKAMGAGRGGGKRGWEDFERLYEEIASLSPEELRDRYFSDTYKKEIKKGTQA
jgi:hypothetical protein